MIYPSSMYIRTRQEQTSYQRQDKIQIHRQEIIQHYKNTHIPLCQRSTALTSPNILWRGNTFGKAQGSMVIHRLRCSDSKIPIPICYHYIEILTTGLWLDPLTFTKKQLICDCDYNFLFILNLSNLILNKIYFMEFNFMEHLRKILKTLAYLLVNLEVISSIEVE